MSLKARCLNPNNPKYKDYGARGIKVCDEWLHSFPNFLKDMGKRPNNMTLNRIDNDGNYEPSNCEWASIHQQSANKRNNNSVVGVSYSLAKRKWVAQLIVKGKHVLAKRFNTYEEAVKARKSAETMWGI